MVYKKKTGSKKTTSPKSTSQKSTSQKSTSQKSTSQKSTSHKAVSSVSVTPTEVAQIKQSIQEYKLYRIMAIVSSIIVFSLTIGAIIWSFLSPFMELENNKFIKQEVYLHQMCITLKENDTKKCINYKDSVEFKDDCLALMILYGCLGGITLLLFIFYFINRTITFILSILAFGISIAIIILLVAITKLAKYELLGIKLYYNFTDSSILMLSACSCMVIKTIFIITGYITTH